MEPNVKPVHLPPLTETLPHLDVNVLLDIMTMVLTPIAPSVKPPVFLVQLEDHVVLVLFLSPQELLEILAPVPIDTSTTELMLNVLPVSPDVRPVLILQLVLPVKLHLLPELELNVNVLMHIMMIYLINVNNVWISVLPAQMDLPVILV